MFAICSARRTVSATKGPIVSRIVKQVVNSASKRTFTSITPLRPTLTSFRPSHTTQIPSNPTTTISDTIAKTSISAHPAFAGMGTQIRCGPRNTFDPSHFVRKRRHGFLSRVRTRKGRALLKRRRAKGRSTLSH